MGQTLWQKFLEEHVGDLQVIIITIGIHGLLDAFENWLEINNYIKKEQS